MELFFESRHNARPASGKLLWTQARAAIHPTPVVPRDKPWDAAGVMVESVVQDGGRYRMWYHGFPEDWGGSDLSHACYAESDNGIDWVKPAMNLVKDGTGPSNRLNASVTGVFIDPDGTGAYRYRGVAFLVPNAMPGSLPVQRAGYYAAHSADGLFWELDSPDPRWPEADVISAGYHPGQKRGLAAYKRNPIFHGFQRRAVWVAQFVDGRWDDGGRALVPDEFDDICALARGYVSGDYYGLSFCPAGSGTVGILQHFRHSLPRTPGAGNHGIFGVNDLSLVYQEGPRDCWQHAPGRLDLVDRAAHPWCRGGLYPSAAVARFGDEHRLYFAGQGQTHAWYLDKNWTMLPRWKEAMRQAGDVAHTSFIHWPVNRLFGYRADPEGVLSVYLGEFTAPFRLDLNAACEPGGSVRAEIVDVEGCKLDDAVALTGDHACTTAAWKQGDLIRPGAQPGLTLRLHMERATAWAYAIRRA